MKDLEEQKLQANGSNTQQQFHGELESVKAYDSEEKRNIFENMQHSYNQQQSNYTQTAYNVYTIGKEVVDVIHSTVGIPDEQPKKVEQKYDYEKNLVTEEEQKPQNDQRYHDSKKENSDKASSGGSRLLSGENEGEEITLGTAKVPKYETLVQNARKTSGRLQQAQSRTKLREEQIPSKKRLAYDKPDYVRNQNVMKRLLQETESLSDKKENTAGIKKKDGKKTPVQNVKEATEAKVGRLRFEEKKIPEKKYKKKINKKEKRKFVARRVNDSIYNKTFEDSDQDVKDLAIQSKNAYRYVGNKGRQHVRTIRKYSNPYSRLKFAQNKEDYLEQKLKHQEHKRDRYTQKQKLKTAKKEEINAKVNYGAARLRELKNQMEFEKGNLEFQTNQRLNNNARKTESEKLKRQVEEKTRQRRELSRKLVQTRAIEEGKFFTRVKNQFLRNKKSVEYKAHVVKKVISMIWAVAGILVLLLFFLMAVLLLGLAFTSGSVEFYGNTVVQADYNTISDVTAYLRAKETDLEESIQPEHIQAEYQGCYEYVYDIGNIGFSPRTLIAYLGAKYGSFATLDEVCDELDALFDEMYELIIEVRDELRDLPVIDAEGNPVYDEYGNPMYSPQVVDVCYVKLVVTPLEDAVEGRMNAEQKKLYDGYTLSYGGQQVYGPVMRENWTDLISSQFGERVHPITGVRTFHNGVDIAVPTGTQLYSAIKGTVTKATYSDTAGYYVRIKNNTGWEVIFMHMDSLAVSEGEPIEKGDFVGYSGNTGNSTGPHLHLEVRNADEEPINPLFIIPSSSVVYSEE